MRRNAAHTVFVFASLLLHLGARADPPRLLDLVNPLQGTDSNIGFSHGGTLPLVGPPWPMTHWAPQTWHSREWFESGGWWFQANSKQVYGFRATHQPSPWMGDYGQFVVMPQTGDLRAAPDQRVSDYDQSAATFRPDYVRMHLIKDDVDAELTASERCGVMRFTFNRGESGRIILDPARVSHLEIDGRTIRGYTTANNGGVPQGWKAYFVARLDRDPTGSGTVDPHGKATANAKTVDGDRVQAYIEFATASSRTIQFTIATSFISYEQAEANLKREASDGFDAVRSRTADAWEKNLARIQIKGGTDEQRRTFYTCLYRAQTFPHKLHEIAAGGEKPIHASVYDGKLHDGPAYGDIGFWDVYRSNFSLWSIVYPEQLRDMLNGFVISSNENNGWMAQWPSPGNRGGMIGTHANAVFADAIAKNIGGFDREQAYASIRQDAFDQPPGFAVGRGRLKDYMDLGYVPAGKDAGYTVSETLDYIYDDWCVAQVAKSLGKDDDVAELNKRLKNYEKLWDPEAGFFRAKRPVGTWFKERFDEYAWSTGYVEGGPWQCTWALPHDVEGMARLMGGKQAMLDKLDRMMGTPPIFHVGEYGNVIHEMAELPPVKMGQYAHGNQPVHHVLYLFAALGEPEKTQYWTRRVVQELYNSGPQGFAGDEDNGEQSSWYVLNTLGLYQLCVGDPTYTLTSPLFDEATIALPGGKTLTIQATNNGDGNVYVQRRLLDGKPFDGQTIGHDRLMQGGTLTVDLAETVPNVKP